MSYICNVFIKDNKPVPIEPQKFSYTGEAIASIHVPFQIKTPIQTLYNCAIKPDENGIAIIYVPSESNNEFYKKKKIIKSLQHPFENIHFTIYKDTPTNPNLKMEPLKFLEIDTEYAHYKSNPQANPFIFSHDIRIHYTNKINNTNPLVEEYPFINLVNLHKPEEGRVTGPDAAHAVRNGRRLPPPKKKSGISIFGLGGRRKTHKKRKSKQTRGRRL
jgi:hypothetical protein